MNYVLLEKSSNKIAWVKLVYQGKVCLLDTTLLKSLYEALAKADRDDEVQAVILTSSGNDFCAGANLKELMENDFEAGILWQEAYMKVITLLRDTGKLVVAAVKGNCVAAGHELVMMCDLVVAGRSSKLGQPEIIVGSTALGGGVQLLPLIVGEKRARELLFTARLLTAEEAYQLGLVNRVVEDGDVEKEAESLAMEIIERSSPQAFRVMKSCLKFWTNLAMLNWQLARDLTALVWSTEEFKERSVKFLEKEKITPGRFLGVTPKED
ncbi:MAG: enoyl-CoA hydratase/isomerase family protein [Candidatus Freyarchaeota archaeon]|nr:enoyl-CoA hydratase/isomerase family protein [Candidatus Freyrarchaeum guaymaensis]